MCMCMWGLGQGGIVAPGSIAATPVEAPVDIEEGMPVEVPLVYYYGHVSPADNPELYKFLVERLASLLDRRAEAWPQRPCPTRFPQLPQLAVTLVRHYGHVLPAERFGLHKVMVERLALIPDRRAEARPLHTNFLSGFI